MILVIDNYDSFTYNLVQYLKQLDENVVVKRNDKITIEEIAALDPLMILISPGPKTPNEAGISLDVVRHFAGAIPILGICLGHQTIAGLFGAAIVKAKEPVHGKVHAIQHTGKGVFQGLKSPLNVTRYHSLIVEKGSLPESSGGHRLDSGWRNHGLSSSGRADRGGPVPSRGDPDGAWAGYVAQLL